MNRLGLYQRAGFGRCRDFEGPAGYDALVQNGRTQDHGRQTPAKRAHYAVWQNCYRRWRISRY